MAQIKTTDFPAAITEFTGSEVMGVISDGYNYQSLITSVSRASTSRSNNVYMGLASSVNAINAVAIGYLSYVGDAGGTAIGTASTMNGKSQAGISYATVAYSYGNVVFGMNSHIKGIVATVIGNESYSRTGEGEYYSGPIVIGNQSQALAATAIAIGNKVIALKNSVIIGSNVSRTNYSYGCTAIGTYTTLNGQMYSTAIGVRANVQNRSIAIGPGAYTGQGYSIAIGESTNTATADSMAIGYRAETNNNYTASMGFFAYAGGGAYSVAIGNRPSAVGSGTAIGVGNAATLLATSIGGGAASQPYTITLGETTNSYTTTIGGFTVNETLSFIKLVGITAESQSTNLTADNEVLSTNNTLTIPSHTMATVTGNISAITADFQSNSSYDAATFSLSPWTFYNNSGNYGEINSAVITMTNNTSGASTWDVPTLTITSNKVQLSVNNTDSNSVTWMANLQVEVS